MECTSWYVWKRWRTVTKRDTPPKNGYGYPDISTFYKGNEITSWHLFCVGSCLVLSGDCSSLCVRLCIVLSDNCSCMRCLCQSTLHQIVTHWNRGISMITFLGLATIHRNTYRVLVSGLASRLSLHHVWIQMLRASTGLQVPLVSKRA
jgi:hypothetical protein